MNSIWFDPRAEEEFLLGVKYYEGQELGLGHCFFLAVQAALKTVSENPQIYRKIFGDCRKCRVVRFPYALIFRERNGEIEPGLCIG